MQNIPDSEVAYCQAACCALWTPPKSFLQGTGGPKAGHLRKSIPGDCQRDRTWERRTSKVVHSPVAEWMECIELTEWMGWIGDQVTGRVRLVQ